MQTKSFLDHVSADLYHKYGSDISKLCLVFPSRRARLFFAESLSKRITQPLWQPESLSITDLIFRWAGQRPTDRLRLLAELYKVYIDLSGQIDSFDRFFHWGETLLHDFDQIDKYLVPAQSLYQNLRDQKALEGDYTFLTPEQIEAIQMFWRTFRPEKTDLQDSFIKMWEIMFPLYDRFNRSLEQQNLAYEGMLYRRVASQPLPTTPSIISYVFIGFNALNTCEQTIFRRLQAQHLALFYWDRDDYYILNAQQEAGAFLQKNLHLFPPADADTPYTHFSQPKEIETWALPSGVLQTKIVPQIIRDNHLYTDKRTAVVLCDESLLIPLLSALPAAADHINVTMGYPLSKTALYSFFDALCLLYKSVRMRGSVGAYYHIEVARLLSHPFIHLLCRQAAEELKKRIIAENILFVPEDAWSADPWLQKIAQYPQNPEAFLLLFTHILEQTEHALLQRNDPDPLLLPVLRFAQTEINKFRSSLQNCGLQISLPLFFNLLRQTLQSLSVPFSGEPLQGIQVMGILETRTLDFEHVVLLSAQEGSLPSASDPPSFIPYNLKIGFGLPVREQHEAIYAYYFYRLLQRAQKVSMLYSAGGDAMQTGEKSRYLLQLSVESPHKIVEKKLTMPLVLPAAAPAIEKEKSGKYRERLLGYTDSGSNKYLSPSAVHTYLQCPLQFYFKYIEQIKEEQEVMEEADGRGLGMALHQAMKSLYAPFRGQMVTDHGLTHLLEDSQQIRCAVEDAVRAYYAHGSAAAHLFEQGRWLILSDVLVTYVTQIIKFDKTRTPFKLHTLEQEYKTTFCAAPHLSVSLGGVIDRIQEQEGICYVIDYKTGKEQRSFESLESLFASERHAQNSAVFQILWYVMLIQETAPVEKILPSLYFIRSFYNPEVSTLLVDKSTKHEVDHITPYMEGYRKLLAHTFARLFDLSLPFTQTSDREHCRYCIYNPICQRED